MRTLILVVSSLGIAFGRPELPVGGFNGGGNGGGIQLDSYAAPIGNGNTGSFITGGGGGPAPQYGPPPQPAQPPVIHKHVYVHVPPPEPTYYAPKRPQAPPPPPQKHYKIVFIKAPTPPPPQVPDIPNLPPPPEQKTLIYVLVKKPDEAPEITIPTPAPTQPSKPEVYFIRYKTQIRYLMDTSSHDFAKIRWLPAYVDKTLFIRDILLNDSKILLVAPPRFGKSTNLSMLKRFLEIPTDSSKVSESQKLFQDLEISKYPNIVNEHLAKYPIIFLNYRSPGNVRTYECAFKLVRRMVHEAYEHHSYLLNSNLAIDEKTIVECWCDNQRYKTAAVDGFDIFDALEFLAEILLKYHGVKPIVLADEYDSICFDAMIAIEDKKDEEGHVIKGAEQIMKDIIALCVGSLSCLLKGNENIDRGIVTGISYLATIGLSKFNNLTVYKFQEDDRFSKYFGLTIDECTALLTKLEFQSELNNVLTYYNGYRNDMLCIWSIMCFINAKIIKNFRQEAGIDANFEGALRITAVRSLINKLLSDMNNEINVEYYPFLIYYKNIMHLKIILDGAEDDIQALNELLMFLTQQGYFKISNMDVQNERRRLQIPNLEIRSEFRSKLLTYYTRKMNINGYYFEYCASLFDQLSDSDENNKSLLFKISECLNEIINPIQFEVKNEAVLRHLIFVSIFLSSNYKCFSESCADTKMWSRLDILLLGSTLGIIIETKYDKNPDLALNLIVKNKYNDAFKNILYNPEQTDVKYYILIGLNMSKDQNITLSVLLNNLDPQQIQHF